MYLCFQHNVHAKSVSIIVFNLNFSVPDYVRYYVEITFLIGIAGISVPIKHYYYTDNLIAFNIKYSKTCAGVFNKFRVKLILSFISSHGEPV